MKVIAVDSFASGDAMTAIQEGLGRTPPAGWKVVPFDTASQLLARLKKLRPSDALEEIEIVSEASPTYLDAIQFQFLGAGALSPTDFGKGLKTVPGVDAATVVYLSGCNSGLKATGRPLKKCIAQTVATASGTTVKGAAGFIEGTHATGDEHCIPVLDGASYPNARSAFGKNCWNDFNP